MKKTVPTALPETLRRAEPTEPAADPKVKNSLDRLRARISDSVETVDGLYPIAPLQGIDAIPNTLTSKAPPQPLVIRPQELWVNRDAYQRSHHSRKSLKLIIKIIENWDWTKFKCPVVTRDARGRYLVIDGQHTSVAAASHPEIEKIPVMYVPLDSVPEQARAFIGHNMDRVNVSQIDLWYARITAEDPLVVQADAILRHHGISVVRTINQSKHTWESNQTMATKRVLGILGRHGPAQFSEIVNFLSQCKFTQIRGDHWRWAEEFLTHAERNSIYQPSLMIEVVKNINEHDAWVEAKKIANSMDLATYQGLDVFYKRRYQAAYRIS